MTATTLARLGRARLPRGPARSLHTTHARRTPYDPDAEPREEELVDVCIVGGGPAGLSAAIRLKQLEAETGAEVRVVVLEKGGEVGAHILSGAVIEPSALDALLPDWRSTEHPLSQPVTSSAMRWLTQKWSVPIPHPPQMNGKGNYIASLSRVAAWLGGVAEELGVEVYPGFAGARFLLSTDKDAQDAAGKEVRSVRGVVTHDAGVTRQRTKSARFEPGVAFRARATLLAEGAHGSLAKQAVAMYDLRAGKEPQTYGIGLKEVWRVQEGKHVPGKVIHTIGWPLDWQTYGGGWEYHMADGLVSVGLVVGLDYKNPWLEPYREFQRMKHHPSLRALLTGGERLAYGARALTEGGLQSLPRLDFPGGAVLGCAAGVVNTAKIKGTHNAMRTGMLAAEAAFAALHPSARFVSTASPATFKLGENPTESKTEDSEPTDAPISLAAYSAAFPQSPAHRDLWAVRNVRPGFNTRLGVWGGVLNAGMDTILGGRVPWTLRHHAKSTTNPSRTSPDALATLPAAACAPIAYPPFEPPLSTDLMSSVALTGTNHAEGEAVHLRVMRGVGGPALGGKSGGLENPDTATETTETAARRRAHVEANMGTYAGLLQRACPAGVYEYVPDDGGRVVPGNSEEKQEEGWEGKKLVINSQNCIHCKLCDIKVPTQDITWTTPEGGGGPKYTLT
ncbi:FAD/NAD-P-binding domain-containing protein [Mycena olivaceomarginata]|nr:FAD/NAD-P-binding domain-containing protein [Mycena olivaceomarginata]